jgi:hypothetical protein
MTFNFDMVKIPNISDQQESSEENPESGKSNLGYIALHRKIRNHWLWEDAEKLKWWIEILMECNHTDKRVLFGGQLLECRRGQSLNSLLTWAKMWRVDVGKVRRFFDLLEKEQMITIENVVKTTRLTVCNYDTYNKGRHANDTQMNSLRHANEFETNTNKNVFNNDKNEKEVITPASADIDIHSYSTIEKTKACIRKFIQEHKPLFPEPYKDLWNLFASERSLPTIKAITKDRKRKLSVRLKERDFDFVAILSAAAKSDFLLSGSWFGIDWIIANESNYIKILEGNYKQKAQEQNVAPASSINEKLRQASAREQRDRAILDSTYKEPLKQIVT